MKLKMLLRRIGLAEFIDHNNLAGRGFEAHEAKVRVMLVDADDHAYLRDLDIHRVRLDTTGARPVVVIEVEG